MTHLRYPSELRGTLLSYAAPYWAMLPPFELLCSNQAVLRDIWAALHPLSYASLYWVTLHPIDQRCTLLSNAAPYWTALCISSFAAFYCDTMHPSELRCTLWAMQHTTELRCTLLWATLHPTERCYAYEHLFNAHSQYLLVQYWQRFHWQNKSTNRVLFFFF